MTHFSLGVEDARTCAFACDQYIDGLRKVLQSTQRLDWGDGFGTFPSGIAVGKKYRDLAIGDDNSLKSTLIAHIAVATNLRDAFLAAGAGYQATEDDNAAHLNRAAGPR